MKGILFQLFEEFARDRLGPDAWYSCLRDATGSEETSWTAPGTYPSADFAALVEAFAERTDLPPPRTLRAFGAFAFPRLAERYAPFLEEHRSARSLLLGLGTSIHESIRRVYPDAEPPSFDVEETPEGLRLTYRSARKWCAFVEGMLDGVASWYGEAMEHRQIECAHRGRESCRFDVRLGGRRG